MHAIILAGGTGKRLWPLSQQSFPKQFLNVGASISLLQKTVKRFCRAGLHDHIVISTHSKLQNLVQTQLEKIAFAWQGRLIVEPTSKNTAPAIALSLKYLIDKKGAHESDICIVCPVDLHFDDENKWISLLTLAQSEAKKGLIVTFGIQPTKVETGYGYIRVHKESSNRVLQATQFIEKPDKHHAKMLIEEGKVYWNSGIFVFQIRTLLQAFKRHLPEIFNWFQQSYSLCLQHFDQLPHISIDHGIMQQQSDLAVIPYDGGWSDIGSWDRMYEMLPKDDQNNVVTGKATPIKVKRSLLHSTNKPLIAIGLDDIIMIETPEYIFATRRGLGDDLHSLIENAQDALSK